MLRCDNTGSITKYEYTPNKSLRIMGTLAHEGWLEYVNPDGSVRMEYVSEEVLFDRNHLDSIRDATMTLLHPPGGEVTPENYKTVTIGDIGAGIEPNRQEKRIDSPTVIKDQDAIIAVVEGGYRGLSMGYECDITLRDSPPQYEGIECYNQINRICNHVAIVQQGRAKDARLHLDGLEEGLFIDGKGNASRRPRRQRTIVIEF